MIGVGESGDVWRMSFRDVQRRANRLANLLVGLGLTRGERVLLLLGQDPWTAIGHVACWKAALCRCRPRRCSHPTPSPTGSTRRRARGHYRPCQPVHRDQARKAAPVVEHVFLIDGEGPGARSLSAALDTARDSFVNVVRRRTIPPSSTSPPAPPAIRKARCRRTADARSLPGIALGFDSFPQPGDLMWSPADWAWAGGADGCADAGLVSRRSRADLPRAAIRSGAGVRDDGAHRVRDGAAERRRCCG